MAKTFQQLKTQAATVRDEIIKGANSAPRVGGLSYDIVEKMEEMREEELSLEWEKIQNKPDTFPPSPHAHNSTDITNFNSSAVAAGQGAGFVTQSWVQWYAAQQSLTPKDFKPTINNDYNNYIQELYIDGSYEGQMAISLLQDTSEDTRMFISDGSGRTIGKCEINGSQSFLPNTIYEITDEGYYSGFHGYVIFSKPVTSWSGMPLERDSIINTSTKNIINAPTIFNKIFAFLRPKKEAEVEWTDNSSVNKVIEELYYPTLPSGASIWLLTDQDDSARLFIQNSSGVLIAKCGRVINKNIRNSRPIYSIYDNDTGRTLLGYFTLSTKYDYNQQGTFVINRNNATTLDNSPRIKAMLDDNRQLILLGDSIPSLMSYYDETSPKGYYTAGQENPLEDMLRSMLGSQVINLCCEGCTYSLRTTYATDYYDKFSAVKWADSISGKSFATQKNASVGSNITYPRSIANTALIDWTKKTTIICEYGTNDLTNGSFALGTLYDGKAVTTAAAKRTIMGAMTYATQTILDRYPLWKMCFVNLFNRTIDGTPISLYTNTASGISAQQLREALAENAERMGLPIISGTDMAERNMFSLMTSTCDGTHNNQVGFFALAKFYARIYEQMNGDDADESAVVMDITGEGGDIGTDSPDTPTPDNPDSGDTGGGTPVNLYSYTNDATYPWEVVDKDGHRCWKSTTQGVTGSLTTMTVIPNENCTLHMTFDAESSWDFIFCTTDINDTSRFGGDARLLQVSTDAERNVWKTAQLTTGTTYYIRFIKDNQGGDSYSDCGWWYIY